MRPNNVVSPRSSWKLLAVVWDGLKSGTDWSIAIGQWKTDENPTGWRPVLASRWDGGENGKGMPCSTGYPVWFVIPDEWYPALVNSSVIPEDKRTFVKNVLGLNHNVLTKKEAFDAYGV